LESRKESKAPKRLGIVLRSGADHAPLQPTGPTGSGSATDRLL